ncbi:hypothetical protein Gotur_031729 [Gossypium turneri]
MSFDVLGVPVSIEAFIFVFILIVGSVYAGYREDVKRSKTGWMSMSQNWGHNWQSIAVLFGQSCSFRVTDSDRRSSTSWNIVPIPLVVW